MRADLNLIPVGFDTLVYVPSISLGPLTRRHLTGLDYFQERNYYILTALQDPTKQVIFVLSNAMQDDLLNAHIDLLTRVLELPADAHCRCHVVKVEQPLEVSLSAALLADTQSCDKIRSMVDKRRAVLDFWTVGTEEILLADTLDMPHLGMPASVAGADSKAAAKRLFKGPTSGLRRILAFFLIWGPFGKASGVAILPLPEQYCSSSITRRVGTELPDFGLTPT